MDANKQKALDAALAQIERQFGKGTVMRMGDRTQDAIPAISTGSLGLDIALGIGGLPKRPRRRNLRPRVLRQDHVDASDR
jgi:recombination protein RecA